MGKARGSISMFLLLICLLLVGVTHLAFTWSVKENEKVRQYIISSQLRNLNGSFYQRKCAEDIAGTTMLYEGTWNPGNYKVVVTATNTYSSDGLIRLLEYSAKAEGLAQVEQCLRQFTVSFSQSWQEIAKEHALISVNFTGKEFLNQEQLYIQATKEEVKAPDFGFMKGKAVSGMAYTDLNSWGLLSRFCYATGSDYSFPEKKTFRGSAVFINQEMISVGNNVYFPDRIVLASTSTGLNTPVKIGKNVRMDKALIISPKTVTIGEGCQITGLIIANNIRLLGNATFTPDASVVAPFVSLVYTN